MGGYDDKTRPCSVCEGRGQVNVLHLQKRCLNCKNEYHTTTLNNQIYAYSSCVSQCEFCKTVFVIESMGTVRMTCPLCIGSGTRTWIDKMIRPYNKKRMEQDIYKTVVGTLNGFD